MAHDTQAAADFLSHFPNFYLQTLDDKATREAVPHRTALPSLVNDGEVKDFKARNLKLVELNNRGAGIFFTPNQFKGRRKKEECLGVNAWICESDDLTKEEQWQRLLRCPLPPSVIVETAKSYHCYWLAKDGTTGNYGRIVRGLVQYFAGDSGCTDVSRVLRIPGFYHNKKEPFMVKVLSENWNMKYSEQEMMETYPYEERRAVPIIHKPIVEGLDFWQAAGRLDNKTLLTRLSGSILVNGEQITFRSRSSGGEYIDINGKGADCWLDPQGMIGSGKGACPTYIQWLEYYGWSKGDIAKWIKENCKDLMPSSAFRKQEKKPEILDAVPFSSLHAQVKKLSTEPAPFSWGSENLDRIFPPLHRSRFIILGGETNAGKTPFAFQMARVNAEKGFKVLFLSLEMSNDGLLLRYAREKLGITEEQERVGNFQPEAVAECVKSLPTTLLCHPLTGQSLDAKLDYISETLKKNKYDMAFIDNFGYIDVDGEDSMSDKAAMITHQLSNLKLETNTTIVALHHFRKKSGSSAKVRPLDDFFGSAKVTHGLDFAIQVCRDMELDADATDKDRAELLVAMNKNRDRGSFRMATVYYKQGEFVSQYEAVTKKDLALFS